MVSDTFDLVPRGSFSWSAALSSMTRLPPLSHVWTGDEREVRLSLLADGDHAPATVWLHFDGALRGRVSDPSRRDVLARQVARIFSLDHDGSGWDALAASEPNLGSVTALLPGLRPVCFSSPYEAACWAILSQRISKSQAARIVERVVHEHDGFPHPEKLARTRGIAGVAAPKVERLRAVATAALDGVLDADRLRALGDVAGPAELRRIPGIGAFWSAGIYLRACGIADVFPDEPRSIAALAHVYGLGAAPSSAAMQRVTDRLRPFRTWACFLFRVAEARGLLSARAVA
jgi:DNA-3-methyladenine glycosylase II